MKRSQQPPLVPVVVVVAVLVVEVLVVEVLVVAVAVPVVVVAVVVVAVVVVAVPVVAVVAVVVLAGLLGVLLLMTPPLATCCQLNRKEEYFIPLSGRSEVNAKACLSEVTFIKV